MSKFQKYYKKAVKKRKKVKGSLEDRYEKITKDTIEDQRLSSTRIPNPLIDTRSQGWSS